MRKILVVCPTPRDKRELPRLRNFGDYDFIYQNYDTEVLEKLIYEEGHDEGRVDDVLAMIDEIVVTYKDDSLAGIISSDDYPGINIASAVAKELGLRCPLPEKVLLCQHKYYARCAQKQYVPEAVPRFALLSMRERARAPFGYPFFLKPVKSVFSCFAQTIESDVALEETFKSGLPAAAFFDPYNQLQRRYTTLEHDARHMIAEELLSGHQATIEGYVFNGEVEIFGITDSIMFPGTICFKRFEYPSRLSDEVQKRVASIAWRCMQGIGFDNGIFNIEFFYNEQKDSIHIIEINPRMASQFADLYEKVDGTNSYETLVALAVGKKPVLKKREGTYQRAASFVLREFENRIACKVPDVSTIQRAHETFPGLRVEIFAEEGRPLSSTLQDGKSYRYGLIHLGADTIKELEEKYSACKRMLDIILQPLPK